MIPVVLICDSCVVFKLLPCVPLFLVVISAVERLCVCCELFRFLTVFLLIGNKDGEKCFTLYELFFANFRIIGFKVCDFFSSVTFVINRM